MKAVESPHHIVLIEDNPADTVLLRHALDEQGEAYTLHILSDGESAMAFVRQHCSDFGPEPCLIVLDLHLPRYDGITVLTAIRAAPDLSHVAVAVLTTIASPEERAEVLALGVQLYRNKPMNWDETVQLAHELIEICKTPKSIAQLA